MCDYATPLEGEFTGQEIHVHQLYDHISKNSTQERRNWPSWFVVVVKKRLLRKPKYMYYLIQTSTASIAADVYHDSWDYKWLSVGYTIKSIVSCTWRYDPHYFDELFEEMAIGIAIREGCTVPEDKISTPRLKRLAEQY